MINQFIEFALNHWEMVALFLATLVAVIFYESKNGAQSLSPSAATNLMNTADAIIVDTRPTKEFSTGHITGSINIPAVKMKENLNRIEKNKEHPIIVVCKSGVTSGATAKDLKKEGFTQVYKLQGGIAEWQSSNLPLVKG